MWTKKLKQHLTASSTAQASRRQKKQAGETISASKGQKRFQWSIKTFIQRKKDIKFSNIWFYSWTYNFIAWFCCTGLRFSHLHTVIKGSLARYIVVLGDLVYKETLTCLMRKPFSHFLFSALVWLFLHLIDGRYRHILSSLSWKQMFFCCLLCVT